MSNLKVVYLYQAKPGESLLDKKNLEHIKKLEDYIQKMDDWKKFCWAKSTLDTSCNDGAFVSALSFLKMQGIDNLELATQDEIDTAFIKSISN